MKKSKILLVLFCVLMVSTNCGEKGEMQNKAKQAASEICKIMELSLIDLENDRKKNPLPDERDERSFLPRSRSKNAETIGDNLEVSMEKWTEKYAEYAYDTIFSQQLSESVYELFLDGRLFNQIYSNKFDTIPSSVPTENKEKIETERRKYIEMFAMTLSYGFIEELQKVHTEMYGYTKRAI